MAATVSGAFVIIDRASSAMKRIEMQARRTDAAISDLGKSLDKVASRQNAKDIDQVSRAFRNYDRELSSAHRNTRQLDRNTSTLTTKLARLGGAARGLMAIVNLFKFPAIIAGVGGLTQIIGALSAGVVALLPRLGRMSAALVSGAAAYSSIGIAAGTAMLAMKGIPEAFKGSETALKRLTPQAREFVRTLKGLAPQFRTIRTEAQRSLFGGLTGALRKARGAIPTMREIVGGMGTTLGGQAERFVGSFTTPGTLKQLSSMAEQARKIIGHLGTTVIHLAHALLNLMLAARPLTLWITKSIANWAIWADHTTRAGLATGRLEKYFLRAKQAIKGAMQILTGWWKIILNVTHAANGLGESLWKHWIRGTERMVRLTGSAKGQNVMRRWFEGMREPLHEVWLLTRELAKQFTALTTGSQGTSMIRSLRMLIKPLAGVIRAMTKGFGPVLADTLRHLVVPIETIRLALDEWGKVLNVIVTGFDWMLKNIPGLKNLIAALVAVLTFQKIFGGLKAVMAGMGTTLGLKTKQLTTEQQILAVQQAQLATMRGQALASGQMMTTKAGGMMGIAPIAGTAAAPTKGIGGLRGLMTAGGLRAAGGMAMGGLRMLGKAAWPLAAAFGIADFLTTEGGIWNKTKGALGGATFGLSEMIPGLGVEQKSPEEEAMMAGAIGRRRAQHIWQQDLSRVRLHKTMLRLRRELIDAEGAEQARLRAQLKTLREQRDTAEGIAEAKAGQLVGGPRGFRRAFRMMTRGGIAPGAALTRITGGVSRRIAALSATGEAAKEMQAEKLAERFLKDIGPLARHYHLSMQRVRGSIEDAFEKAGKKVDVVNRHIVESSNNAWKKVVQIWARPTFFAEQALPGRQKGERRIEAALKASGFSEERIDQIMSSAAATLPGAVSATGPPPGRRFPAWLKRLMPAGPAPPGAGPLWGVPRWAKERWRAGHPNLRERGAAALGIDTGAAREAAGQLPGIIEKGLKDAREPLQEYQRQNARTWDDIHNKQVGRSKDAADKVKTEHNRMRAVVVSNNEQMEKSTARATSRTRQDFISKLKGLGITGTALQAAVTGRPAAGQGGGGRKAGGGRLAGTGTQDTIPLGGGYLAAPGEMIVNRHTEGRVNSMLAPYGTSLQREVYGEGKPHSAMARGGRTAWRGLSAAGLGSGVRKVASAVMGRYPLSATSTVRPGDSDSFHGVAQAVDLGGTPQAMHAASAWIKRSGLYRQLAEGIHNPNLSVDEGQLVPPSFWGAGTWAGHADHIHLAVAHAVGKLLGLGPGGTVPKLKHFRGYQGPGTMRQAFSQRAVDNFRAAAQGRLRRTARRLMGPETGVSLKGIKGNVPATFAQVARRLHAPWRAVLALFEAGLAESQMGAADPGNVLQAEPFINNPNTPASQAMGFLTGKHWTGTSAINLARTTDMAAHHIAQAVQKSAFASGSNYLAQRAPALALMRRYGFQHGGRMPWFGSGTDFVARGPQIIGVGDKGPERVTVTPAGKGGPGGVRIGAIHIENHREGDIRRQIEVEVGQAFRNLGRHLDTNSVAGGEFA